jgi:hypothetical protein
MHGSSAWPPLDVRHMQGKLAASLQGAFTYNFMIINIQFLWAQDLATLEVSECNLPTEVPKALAAHLPRNLQTLQLRYVTRMWHTEAYEARAFGAQGLCSDSASE